MRRLLAALLLVTAGASPALALPPQPTPGQPTELLAWSQADRDGRSEVVVADATGGQAFRVGGGIGSLGRPALAAGGQGLAVSVPLGELTGRYGLAVLGFDGSRRVLTRPDLADVDPAWSPDGRLIAAVRRNCPQIGRACDALITVDAASGAVSMVGAVRRRLREPAWSHDGGQIAYVDDRGLWSISPGGGIPRLVFPARGLRQPAWSPTDDRIAVVQQLSAERSRVAVIPVAGGRPVVLSRWKGGHDSPRWSDDAHLLVLLHRGVGDAGRSQVQLVLLDLTGRWVPLRRLPHGAHGLAHGWAVSGSGA